MAALACCCVLHTPTVLSSLFCPAAACRQRRTPLRGTRRRRQAPGGRLTPAAAQAPAGWRLMGAPAQRRADDRWCAWWPHMHRRSCMLPRLARKISRAAGTTSQERVGRVSSQPPHDPTTTYHAYMVGWLAGCWLLYVHLLSIYTSTPPQQGGEPKGHPGRLVYGDAAAALIRHKWRCTNN